MHLDRSVCAIKDGFETCFSVAELVHFFCDECVLYWNGDVENTMGGLGPAILQTSRPNVNFLTTEAPILPVMDYEQERKRYISFCGSYCHTCDWFTGRIRRVAQAALDLVDLYGFRRLLEGKVDPENLRLGLEIIANSAICSGCKAEVAENPADDRCKIHQCCFRRGFDQCSECENFPCDLLKNNPGVIKFHCIENLREIQEMGLEKWIDKQWKDYVTSHE